jgi:hypothetical protein
LKTWRAPTMSWNCLFFWELPPTSFCHLILRWILASLSVPQRSRANAKPKYWLMVGPPIGGASLIACNATLWAHTPSCIWHVAYACRKVRYSLGCVGWGGGTQGMSFVFSHKLIFTVSGGGTLSPHEPPENIELSSS